MSLDTFSDQILTWLVIYGPPMLAVALFIGALGIPLPGTLFVIAAGAFVRQGVLDVYLTLAIGLAGVAMGDMVSYALGRGAHGPIQRRWGETAAWGRATTYFEQRGGLAIYLSRWLVTPIAVPVNLVAGSSGYSAWRFAGYDVAGEATWFMVYGGLGYAFGSQWELISTFVSDFSGVAVGIVMVVAGLFTAVRREVKKHKKA